MALTEEYVAVPVFVLLSLFSLLTNVDATLFYYRFVDRRDKRCCDLTMKFGPWSWTRKHILKKSDIRLPPQCRTDCISAGLC